MPGLATWVSALFVVSTLFPIGMSVARIDRPPAWIGVADVTVAAALLAGALTLATRHGRLDARAAATSCVLYRLAANVFLVLLVLFFTVGGRIDWTVLLVGLAWRFWLLFYVLPVLVSQFQDKGTPRAAPSST